MKMIVRAVYEKYQTYDPFTLAAKMGAFVTEDDLQGIYAYFAHIDNFKIICLNAGLSHYQKAFVLAHCLYHVYRGAKITVYRYRGGIQSKNERDGNLFAHIFLSRKDE